jgi:hypothetical protein
LFVESHFLLGAGVVKNKINKQDLTKKTVQMNKMNKKMKKEEKKGVKKMKMKEGTTGYMKKGGMKKSKMMDKPKKY